MGRGRTFKYFALIVFTTLFLWGFYVFGKKVKQRWIVYTTLNSQHWKERLTEIGQIEPGKFKTIFFGNSLIELFDLDFYFKDSTFLNCGIVGDFSEGLVERAGTVAKLKPNKIFIEIGINDLIEKISLDEINSNYKEVIRIIQTESPGTQIYIISNLPVIINRPGILTDDLEVNDMIKKQNRNLLELARNNHCTYIDVYASLAREKDRGSLFIWDGIHLTPKAYGIWKKVLIPYLDPVSAR